MPIAGSPRLLFALLLGCSCMHAASAAEFVFAPTPLAAAIPDSVQLPPAPQLPSTVPSAGMLQALPAADLQQLERELGAYAPELATTYLQSALAQQRAGRHSEALATLAKAAHSERLHNGLFTPGQFDLVALEVQSHLARRDYLKAFERQQHLLFLQHRHYGEDSLEAVPTRAALGDLYFDAFRKVLLNRADAARLVPDYGPQSLYLAPEDLTRHQLAYLWLSHAQREYQTAIDTLLTHKAWSHPQLVQLEEQLIQSLLLQAFERRVAIDPANFLQVRDPQLRDTLRMDEREYRQPFYRAGIEAHERIIAYRQAAAADSTTVTEAMLALGDWHLLFGHTRAARLQYAKAQDHLGGTDCDPGLAARILQPALPRQLPVFEGLDGTVVAPEFSGYVDVAFNIGKSGRAEDIEVLGGTQNADARVQRKLRQQLRRAPFRPGLDAKGKLMGEQRVSVRYHFAQI